MMQRRHRVSHRAHPGRGGGSGQCRPSAPGGGQDQAPGSPRMLRRKGRPSATGHGHARRERRGRPSATGHGHARRDTRPRLRGAVRRRPSRDRPGPVPFLHILAVSDGEDARGGHRPLT